MALRLTQAQRLVAETLRAEVETADAMLEPIGARALREFTKTLAQTFARDDIAFDLDLFMQLAEPVVETSPVASIAAPRCTCEWADYGDGESGPRPEIVELDPNCPDAEHAAAARMGDEFDRAVRGVS